MDKPVIVCLGNCQSGSVRAFLSTVPEIAERFEVVFSRRPEHFNSFKPRIAVVIRQATHGWNDFDPGDVPLLIRYPAALMSYPWPLIPYQERVTSRTAESSLFPYTIRDALVLKLKAEGVPRDSLLDAYFAVDMTRRFPLERLRAINEAKGRQIDALSDFPVWDRMQAAGAMKTANHPDGPLFAYMLEQIVERLPLEDKATAIEMARAKATGYGIQLVEAPVHPQVADALGLDWAKNRKWTFWLEGDFTFEEHLLRLYDMTYCKAFHEGIDRLRSDPEDAIPLLEQAVRELPGSMAALNLLLSALTRAGKVDRAAEVRKQMWDLDPTDQRKRVYWSALRRARRFDDATALYPEENGADVPNSS